MYDVQRNIYDVPMHEEAVGMLDVDNYLVVVVIDLFEI
jgi:hypothetical protein